MKYISKTPVSRIFYEKIWITSEELKEFVYCRRIPYFRRFLSYEPYVTIKTEKGQNLHVTQPHQLLLKGNKTTYLNILLEDRKARLQAVLDKLVLVYPKSMEIGYKDERKQRGDQKNSQMLGKVVECKTGFRSSTITDHQKAQLALQAVIVENAYNLQVRSIAIEETDGTPIIEEELTREAKYWVMDQVTQLRKLLATGILPHSTCHKGKCYDCEYWQVCLRA